MMHHEMTWHGWGGHMFGWWGLILGVILIASIIYFVFRSSEPTDLPGSSDQSPLEILERRYAEGEIDREEFQRRKEDLKT